MTGPPLLPWSVRIELIGAAKAVSHCTHPLTTLAYKLALVFLNHSSGL